jgi:uncharacterized protein
VNDPSTDNERPAPVAVPYQELSADALRGVVESFVLREGTDYGDHEVAFDTKVAQVIRQLEHGDAGIVFDPLTETIHIVVKRNLRELR